MIITATTSHSSIKKFLAILDFKNQGNYFSKFKSYASISQSLKIGIFKL